VVLKKEILKEFGYDDVVIMSPGSDDSYRDFGEVLYWQEDLHDSII